MPNVLINPQGLAEQVDPNTAQAALAKGYQVPLIDQEGNATSAPYEDAAKLVQSGTHQQPNPEQLQTFLDAAEYSGTGHTVKSFLRGAAGSLLPGAGVIEAGLGGATTEEQRKEAAFHPAAHTTGEVAGTVGGLLLSRGASAPGLIAKAGEAVAGALTGSEEAGLVAKALKLAARGAAEGGLMGASHEVNEALLGSPDATAENIWANIGKSALYGGALSLAFAPAAEAIGMAATKGGQAFGKVGQKINDIIEKVGTKAAETVPELGEEGAATTAGEAPSIKSSVMDLAKQYAPSPAELTKKAFDYFAPAPVRMAVDLIKKGVKSGLFDLADEDSPRVMALLHLNSMAGKAVNQMEKHAGAIFGSESAALTGNSGESNLVTEPIKMDKTADTIMAHAQNPEGLADHLAQGTGLMQAHAPATMTAFATTAGNAVNFLAQKLPKPPPAQPLDPKPQFPNSDIAKFNRSVAVVKNPMMVLTHVKNGTLLPQDMEALSSVTPNLYAKMRETVTSKMAEFLTKHDASEIPPKTRVGLSMFLASPMDSSLLPQGIISNQAALAASNVQKQIQQPTGKPKPARAEKIHIQDETRAQHTLNRSR